MRQWVNYKNGNYTVALNIINGTKIRTNTENIFIPDTVESIDIKITNYCTGATKGGCRWCHEKSSPFGKHGDILNVPFLEKLHPYCELAIGGGNPLSHPDLEAFLLKCRERNHIPNMTVNQVHFEKEFERIKGLCTNRLIFGLGISLVKATPEFIEKVKQIPNAVIHVINGIVSAEDLINLKEQGLKLLILGYKEVRRGKDYYEKESDSIERGKIGLKTALPIILANKWFNVVSFDNLAIKQLSVRELMSEEEWSEFYMGDDGLDGKQDSATMYVDLVEKKFAKNSCSMDRFDLLNTVEEMFTYLQSVGEKVNED